MPEPSRHQKTSKIESVPDRDLCIENLSFTYSSKAHQHAFELGPVSFVCPAGQLTCIVGPSGSGKSTILKLISGELDLQGGAIVLGNQRLSQAPYGSRGTASVPQGASLLPYLTAYENIRLGPLAANAVERGIDGEVEKWIRQLDLVRIADRFAEFLSGGERQRVAIARALAVRPDILLFDEPTASLDMLARDLLADIVRGLKTACPSMVPILVTHDREFCLSVADRIAVLDRGKLRWCGAAADLLSSPDDPRVYEILGGCVLLSGNVESANFVARAISNGFSDIVVPLTRFRPIREGRATFIAPRASIAIVQGSRCSTMAIEGIVERASIGIRGGVEYDVRLRNGVVWRGLSADESTHSTITLDELVFVRLSSGMARVLPARCSEEHT